MAPQVFISYGGLNNILGMSFPYMRGVTPSVCTLLCQPQDNLDLSPGDLSFGFAGGQPLTFTNCAVAACNLRLRADGRPLQAIQVMDRRWKWGGSISGTYNDHLQGTAALVSARDLMFLCLQALGENTADVSLAPQNVYPYVNWNATNPKLALADLCDRCACEVVLNPLTDAVEIWPLGIGQSSPTDVGEQTPKYRYVPRAKVPASVEVQGGPSNYQYRLALEAVGRGTNLLQSRNPDWLSGVNVAYETWNWPSVTSTLGSELALATGWKYFRVKGQEGGGLNVPGLSIPITSTSQYVLKDFIIYTSYDDRTGKYELIDYYLEGDFWPYSDLPSNTSNQVYVGDTTLYKDRLLVETKIPVIKLDSSGYTTEPTLYLQTMYNVKDVFGNFVRVVRSGAIGGSGGTLVLKRPEVVAGYAALGNNESLAVAELDAYVQLFQRKFANPYASILSYAGLLPGTLDGNIAQCMWQIHPAAGPTTIVCEQEELIVTAPDRAKRRRREQLQMLVDSASIPELLNPQAGGV